MNRRPYRKNSQDKFSKCIHFVMNNYYFYFLIIIIICIYVRKLLFFFFNILFK